MSEVRNEFLERLSAERANAPDDAITSKVKEPVEGDPETGDDPIGEFDDTDNTDDLLSDDQEPQGDPDLDAESEVSPEYMELESKYKSLEAEFSRVTANRKEIESSLDTAKASTVKFSHELEDKYQEAEQFANYFAGMATQQLQQLQSVNPAQLSQDQYGQYQQMMMQAQQQAQQFGAMSEQIKASMAQTKESRLQREAEIARERLKTRIPDWSSDKYKQLGEVAADYGYSQEEFFQSTDYRMILLLNEVQKSKEAAKVVEKKVAKTKANPPKHRAARPQDRNDRGQYSTAQKQFTESSPGTKGAFAAMKAAQLRAERNKR